MFEQVTVNREVFGNGENLLICGSVMKLPEEIRTKLSIHFIRRFEAAAEIALLKEKA